MASINIMLIGAGFHARRIYIPTLIRYSKSMPITLVGGVDLTSQKDVIEKYLHENNYDLEMIYLDTDYLDSNSIELGLSLQKNVISELDAFVDKFNITGVIISTDPLSHKVYAEWALKRNLHILMDKPISVRKFQNTKLSQAVGVLEDYYDLLESYKKVQDKKSTIFSINIQRRYDYGFEKVKKLIIEAKEKFNIPVTSIQAMHADGTWVFPKEILFQKSHSYQDGYGKCSHSGYHIFDMVWQLYEAGIVQEKQPNSMQIFSSALFPSGFRVNITERDYRNYFKSEYQESNLTREEYVEETKEYGEIDSFNILRFLKNGENICNVSINLLHNSFSKRAWAIPNKDLYKGNGRVKHQQFIIQQGPFQSIHVHNYQSEDMHDIDNTDEFDIGGNNHFDIYIFRNNKMFGSGSSFKKITGKDIEKNIDGQLTIEKAKDRVILEYLNFMLGNIKKEDLKSNIDSQTMPVKIMSGIYQSNALLYQNENPLVTLDI